MTMNIFKLGLLTATKEAAMQFLLERGLLNLTTRSCSVCGFKMSLEKGKERHGLDGRWRCGKKNCRKTMSVFKGTIWDGIHIPISSALRLIYCWSINMKVTEAALHCEVSAKPAIEWYKMLRRIATLAVISRSNQKIGGPGLTVEIDESHICKRKFGVGRVLVSQAVWIIGGICRETKEVFLKTSSVRNRRTLESIVSSNVHPGSTIITDCWRGYLHLNDLGFQHYTVNHSFNFIHPDDNTVHTQTIERVWKGVKRFIPKETRSQYKEDYINEYLFRSLYPCGVLERFEVMLNIIREYFN